jgi:SEC-C motif
MSRKRKVKKQNTNRKRGQNKTVPSTYSKDYMSTFAGKYQEVFDDINNHIRASSELVSKMNPVKLLTRGYGEYTALVFGKTAEAELDEIHAIAMRMIDYVQCLVVSTPPHSDGYISITEESWGNLKFHVSSVFNKMIYYFIAATAKRENEPNFDEIWEGISTKAQMNWCFVKGNRHLNYLGIHLKSLLNPHNDIFSALFGITTEDFVGELEKIQISLTRGIFDSGMEMRKIHKDFFERIEQDIESLPDEGEEMGAFFRRKMEEYGYKTQFEAAGERFFGSDLFDLSEITSLPSNLLDHLSLSPGEEKRFFSEGEFKGWPLSLWPTWNKPFLKIDNKFYCFDMYTLSDNIYRAIQKIIFQLKPEYKDTWINRQQQISEDLPFQMLDKLLSGAKCYRNVYYTRKTGQVNARNWVECDGLLIYDDHLFIVEVKAGSFTYTPPATDAPAYIQSIKDLLFKPAEQGHRFLEYLKSAERVAIYDNNHAQVGELSSGEFRQITICCVTLDQITQLAAKSSHLKITNNRLPADSIWNISIDDLRVYTDILRNPLQFLHFVEQRHAASKTPLIILDDELDHLGMYLAKNRYTQFANELVASESSQPDLLVWTGFTADIDKYYASLLAEEDAIPPQQVIPPLLVQILDALVRGAKPGRSRVASILLNMSGETRNSFVKTINRAIDLTRQRGRPQPVSLFGDTRITIYSNPNVRSFSESLDLVEYVLSVMTLRQEQERLLLEVFINESGMAIDVNFSFVKTEDIERYERNDIDKMAKELADKRIQQAISQGKIKFNGQCPCGSGKKYKYCHGPLKRL